MRAGPAARQPPPGLQPGPPGKGIREFYNSLPPPRLSAVNGSPRVKFLLDNWYWIVTALVSGGALLWPVITRSGSNAVSPQEAVQLINREKAVVVDVCEPAEFAAGHVVNARNFPLGTLGQADGLKGLPTNKQLPLVVVCAKGARAAKAAGLLGKAGHQRVLVLAGGMAAWREANMPVEKSA